MKPQAPARLASLGAVMLLALPARAQPPAQAQASGQPQATAPAAPVPVPSSATANTPAPATATPQPVYPYPPPYPPGYAYPPGYPQAPPPGYPGYPPGYAAYPAPPPAPETEAPLPSGKWRLGGSLFLIPHASLVYDLKYRGEPLDYYDRGVSTTAGVALFTEVDVLPHLFLGLALQCLPSIKWVPLPLPPGVSREEMPSIGGVAREYDLLPQFGGYVNATPRLRLLAYLAPGYSLLDTSSLDTTIPIKHGTTHGFVLQAGGGMLYAVGQHGFFAIRGLYQRSSSKEQVPSPNTGQSAEPTFFFSFFALQGSGGFWF